MGGQGGGEKSAPISRDPATTRRKKAIERVLASTGWADHWVGYWQDVLAENPGILKPDLNNTGPFRWWLHQSFADNMPIDRFVDRTGQHGRQRLARRPRRLRPKPR